LVGFVTLTLKPSGLVLRDCALHKKGDREWIGLPGRPLIDRDGQPRKGPATGKLLYTPVVEIPDKQARDRFLSAALASVHRMLGGRGQ
jgi:hypothetical protein